MSRMTNKEYQRRYREKNRAKINERKAAWMAARPGYGTEYRKRWKKENRERVWKAAREIELRAYGINLDGYSKMLAAQGGACKICREPPTKVSLHVDHCHSTGRVRGLLCSKCNLMLGNARDSRAVLLAAVAYLEEQ